MHKHKIPLIYLIPGMLLLLLAACAPAAELAEGESIVPTDVPPATKSPTATIPSPTETVVAVDSCTSCHVDKERLIDTANAEEEVISENEGEG